MRTIRLFCSSFDWDENITVSDVQFRYLAKVLRLKRGDNVELFDGKGKVGGAIIEKIVKASASLRIQSVNVFQPRCKQRIVIAASMAKAQRFEQIIEMCSQLGIDRIVPVIFARTVKQADSEAAAKRFESIAIESAKQCGRNFLPIIDKPLNFEETVENLHRDYPNARIIFGSLTNNAASVINFKFELEDIVAFIGPEGGLTDDEENLLKKINAEPVRLTDTILRIETAAITIASILAAKRDSSAAGGIRNNI